MKILQINSVCGVGSTGRIATDLYKVLEEQGHECKIAYGRGNAPKDIDSIKIGSKLDNYYHVFKTRVFDKHGFGSINATKKFIEEVKQYNPDVIHLHNIHGYYINIEILFNYLKEANKPVIWTLHDCWAFTGHCPHFDYIGCDKWEKGCNNCEQKQGYPASKIFDNSKLNYEKKKELFTSIKNMTIVTPSSWLSEIVKKSILSKYEVKVIPNGIDLSVFTPTESNFRKKYDIEDKHLVLGVANIWSEKKGLYEFIKLAELLNNDYMIVMVGLSNKQILDISHNNIIGISRTNNIQELVEIYTAADIFVNPSVEETMGLVTLESIACGTPAIVYDATAVPEVIDKTCGVKVKKNHTQDIVNEIEQIINQKRIMKEDCIKKAQNYEKHEIYIKYINLYKLKNTEY